MASVLSALPDDLPCMVVNGATAWIRGTILRPDWDNRSSHVVSAKSCWLTFADVIPDCAARRLAMVSAMRGLVALAIGCLLAGVLATDSFVSVPTTGLESGWAFTAYRFNPQNNFAEIPGSRRRGVVGSTRFSSAYGRLPAAYGLGGAKDFVMVEWTGFLRIVLAGTYKFRLGSDDGSVLYIDGRVVSPVAHMLEQAMSGFCPMVCKI